jgi:predicted MFS family arabinose efflux permease
MLRLTFAVFLLQLGFHSFTASIPLALSLAGVGDPEIGIVMGSAPLVMVPAAFVAGAFVDRYGGGRLLLVGAAAYLIGAAILLLPGVGPGGGSVPFLASRMFGGIGLAIVLPAALSLVPRLVETVRRGFALSVVNASQNLALIVGPALSVAILMAVDLRAVAAAVLVVVTVGAVLTRRLPFRIADDATARIERGLRFTFRRTWLVPLLIVVLYVAHWGAVTAYLPQRAHAVGADIGLFFAADGVGVVLLRLPAGWLSDRFPTRYIVWVGIALSIVGLSMLIPSPTTPILVASGFLGGAGGALVLTPLLVEISRRSDDADRGSAFALYAGSLAAAIALGSLGFAPFIDGIGFGVAMAIGIGLAAGAAVLTFLEPGLRTERAPVTTAATTPPG